MLFLILNSDLTQEERYGPDIADDKYKENLKSKGGILKIRNDIRLANYIEDKIVNGEYSPAAVLEELKAQEQEGEFTVTICITTFYGYIKYVFLFYLNQASLCHTLIFIISKLFYIDVMPIISHVEFSSTILKFVNK